MNRKHLETGSATYRSWRGMIERTENPNNPDYKNYGGRGIRVCKRWRISYEAFKRDMGDRPAGMTLDRMNTNGNYCKSNCQWATAKQQAASRRGTRLITLNGITDSIGGWSKRLGHDYTTVYWRLKNGWTLKEALT